MVQLGQWVTVELPEQEAQRYNDGNPAAVPVKVGEPVPGLVTRVNQAHQSPDPRSRNTDGSPVMNDVPETVNLRLFYDGAGDHHVLNVPSDLVTVVGENKSVPKENANDTPPNQTPENSQPTLNNDPNAARFATPVEPPEKSGGVPVNPVGQNRPAPDDWNK